MLEHLPQNLDKEDQIVLKLAEKTMAEVRPRPDFKKELFQQLSNKYYSPKSNKSKSWWYQVKYFFTHSTKFPALVASVFIIVLGLGLTSTYAYVNPDVTRGHSLYLLKKAIENIEYGLTITNEGKVEKNLYFTDRRKQELKTTYSSTQQIDEEVVTEISENLNNAYAISNKIKNPQSQMEATQKITIVSKEVTNALSKIVQELEQRKPKAKVKRKELNLEQIKEKIEKIEKKTENFIQKCTNECQANSKICSENGAKQCGNFDQDQCLEWSTITACARNEICQNGICIVICQDECQENSRQCVGANYQICGNFDSDICKEWGEKTLCESDLSCQEGICKPIQELSLAKECQNECSALEKKYLNKNTYQTCGNFDQDSCLEWSEPILMIKTIPSCQNECETEGKRSCKENGYIICGQYDQDICLEWGEINLCASNNVCKEGICGIDISKCQNKCQNEGERICETNSYRICGNFDADSCLEFSEKNECPSNTHCKDGTCL